MSQDEQKRQSAKRAMQWLEHKIESDQLEPLSLGIGTGSTVNYFIELIETIQDKVNVIVSSSARSSDMLGKKGIAVGDPNSLASLDFYVDGADEINAKGEMIKGGGGAHTGEKIIASLADCFVCLADESKKVDVLGGFPVAVEVLADARSYVSREIVKRYGAQPELRHGFVSDYGHPIIDIHNLDLTHARDVENQINSITGVVENGIFSCNRANFCFVADDKGVDLLEFDGR